MRQAARPAADEGEQAGAQAKPAPSATANQTAT